MDIEQATILALQNKLTETIRVNDDDMNDLYKMEIYLVCMDTYSGKRLYLAQMNGNIVEKVLCNLEVKKKQLNLLRNILNVLMDGIFIKVIHTLRKEI